MATGDWVELQVHYNGVYVFLSYLVSVVGAWTTLEMMLKRTGSTGVWNVMLLIGAGIAFGSTATFGMHFVGNQAVTLRLPAPWEGRGVPLSYNAGYTILSLVVSCLSMILAFSFIGLRLFVPRGRSRLTDEEHGSTEHSEKSMTREGESLDDEVPEMTGNSFAGEQKSPDLGATGAAFDPDLKVENGQQTRFALPGGRKMSLAGTAFNIQLPKRGSKEDKEREERRRQEDEEEEEENSEDGGDFGVSSASVSRWGVFKVLMAGIVCGGGIAAMHYVGQVSINSVPRVTNNWYTILLSVIIAMACVSVGLYILFVIFRPKLQHSWYKRVIVAMILGVGVTLMHFVALLGTHYWAIEGQSLESGNNDGTKTLIIALICVVAPVCCILLLIFAFIGQQRILRQRLARHRIILSTAIFDQQGLLLVQPESGLLPSAKIYPSKSNEAEKVSFLQMLGIGNRLSLQASKLKLARSDPAFIAFLKMSWAWRSKRGPVPGGSNAAFAGAPGAEQESAYGGTGSRSGEDGGEVTGISTPRLSEAEDEMTGSEAEIMRRSVLSFEMASEEIATQLTGSNDLKVLGVMYDSILKIGHFQVSSKSSGDRFTVTQGQMLVLARRLKNNAEREALVARGFVFAEPGAVSRVTSNAYAVPTERVFDYFRDVYRFTRFGVVKRLDRGRLYGGLLMLQALPGEGLHVVVDDRQHHSLPMTEVAALVDPSCDRSKFASYPHLVTTLEDTIEALEELGGKSLSELVAYSQGSSKDPAGQLRNAIVNTLRPHIERLLSTANLSVLLSRITVAPHLIPLTSRTGPLYGGEGLVKDSYFICLKAVVPSSVTLPGPRLHWLPFSLYQAQSECVSKASGSTVSGPRPNTGGSVVESARFGGGWSASSQASGGRKASVSDHFGGESDVPFGTSSSAPFTSTAFPSSSNAPRDSKPLHPLHAFNAPTGPSGQRGSTYSTSSNNEDEDDSTNSPRPMTGPQAADLPEGVPDYSPDWIVGLVRDAVRAPGQTMSHWDVPHGNRKSRPRRSDP
ncbi:hypothetical protein JCM11251_003025 [Rhodosporidiobolus azoricus]